MTSPSSLHWEADLQFRLEATKAAQDRSRLALFGTTLISIAILVGIWNAYLSTYRSYAIQHHESLADPTKALGASKLQQELLAQWVRSRFITISLIGVTVGVGDAPFLGGFALMIACTWYYLSIRREHYNIGRLIIDVVKLKGDYSLLSRVYNAINSYTIFTIVVPSNEPYRSISDGPVREDRYTLFPFLNLFHFLPTIVASMALLFDILSVYNYDFRSGFRYPDEGPLAQVLKKIDAGELHNVHLAWVGTVILLFLIATLSFFSARFSYATQGIMKQLLEQILHSEGHAYFTAYQGLFSAPGVPGAGAAMIVPTPPETSKEHLPTPESHPDGKPASEPPSQ